MLEIINVAVMCVKLVYMYSYSKYMQNERYGLVRFLKQNVYIWNTSLQLPSFSAYILVPVLLIVKKLVSHRVADTSRIYLFLVFKLISIVNINICIMWSLMMEKMKWKYLIVKLIGTNYSVRWLGFITDEMTT